MHPLETTTTPWLVVLSVLTSVVASYAAFSFAERLIRSTGLAYCLWLTGGSTTLGFGIWSMHYLGMLAVNLPVEVVYHIPTVALSLVCAVLASVIVLAVVSRKHLTFFQISMGSVLMGSGIGAMHYVGMHAMRCSAMHHYDRSLVLLSVATAIGFSWLALWIAFSVCTRTSRREWLKMSAATYMGLGIASMHYIAMAAVTFMPGTMDYPTGNTLHISSIGILAVTVTTGIVLFGALVTALLDRKVYERLAEERDRFHAAADSMMDSLYICSALRDSKGDIEDFLLTYLNQNAGRRAGLPVSEMVNRRICEVLPIILKLGHLDLYRQVVLTGEPLVTEFFIPGTEESERWIRLQAVKLRDGIVITSADITARKRDEQKILHLAHHDPLTGLINRSLLPEHIGLAIENAKRHGNKFGVFLIDLDSFKQVNDTLGHAAGDAVLIMTAQRLRVAVRGCDSVIRLGGDEFVIVMQEISDLKDLAVCATKILGVVQEPYVLGEKQISVSCSIGVAVYPTIALTGDELLFHADAAMYKAKRRGKNQVELPSEFEELDFGISLNDPESPLEASFSARPTSASGAGH